mgnify:CR=1 FL=1|jgi:hypothetical protein
MGKARQAMCDYNILDHIPEKLVFPFDGESHSELKKDPFRVFADLHKLIEQ